MTIESQRQKGHYLDIASLPESYPTMHLPAEFWELLGRAIATFGFLEEILGKAIFAMTATKLYDDEQELTDAYEKWNSVLEKALYDQLGNLISSYEKAATARDIKIADFSSLVAELRSAVDLRNVLCHGSWKFPDEHGHSVPLFVNRKMEIFETAIDVEFLRTTQRAVAELSCEVINTVTIAGWQFPGTNGPGLVIGG